MDNVETEHTNITSSSASIYASINRLRKTEIAIIGHWNSPQQIHWSELLPSETRKTVNEPDSSESLNILCDSFSLWLFFDIS